MKSHLTENFITCFNRLPERVKQSARRAYQFWRDDPHHPGLQFKRVGRRHEVYSVRVGIGWRAIGVKDADTMVWFWIGSHAQYDRLLQRQ